MNRQKRRMASKLQNDPRVKGYVDKFAKELSSIIVDHFDSAAKAVEEGKDIDLNYSSQTKELLVKKGEELRKFATEFANDVGKQARQNNIKINIK